MGQDKSLVWKNPLETAWVGPKVVWGRASGNHQGGANSVSQVNGVPDMAPACQLYGSVPLYGEGSEWDSCLYQLFCL